MRRGEIPSDVICEAEVPRMGDKGTAKTEQARAT